MTGRTAVHRSSRARDRCLKPGTYTEVEIPDR
jgi:hypothetical protein